MADRQIRQELFHDQIYRQTISEIGVLRNTLPQDALASLAKEVIKRLSDHSNATSPAVHAPPEARIESLARAFMDSDVNVGLRFVEAIRAEGASIETVYLVYLARAARKLGEWWEDDAVSFVEVGLATGHIYAVMRGLKPLFPPISPRPQKKSAFFALVPGETHALGVEIAADMFRRRGWDITLKTNLDHDALISQAVASGPSVIGLSAAGEHALGPLARLVVALRISLPNSAIMLSGNIVNTSPELLKPIGLDGHASGFDEAFDLADRIWANDRASATRA